MSTIFPGKIITLGIGITDKFGIQMDKGELDAKVSGFQMREQYGVQNGCYLAF